MTLEIPNGLTVMMIGCGGREHSIIKHCSRSTYVKRILAFGTNVGIINTLKVEIISFVQPGIADLASIALNENVDLTIVGPEQLLADGIVDYFNNSNLNIFGPTHIAAQLESSKWYSKEVMLSVGVQTALATRFTSLEDSLASLEFFGVPVVVKYDGLKGGKGVKVCDDIISARTSLSDIYNEEPEAVVLLEDKLIPHPDWKRAEISIIGIVDIMGNFKLLRSVQDYKTAFDGDIGPNTGGMGCFTPVPGVTKEHMEEIGDTIFKPIINEMKRRGTPFSGVLYAGLMFTENGFEVIEFNVRFGDPECQVLMESITSDLVPIMYRVARGDSIADSTITFDEQSVVGVVVAQEGYPTSSAPAEAPSFLLGSGTYHAGTTITDDQKVMITGGRGLLVTGKGSSIKDARRAVYDRVGNSFPPGLRWRNDIAEGV